MRINIDTSITTTNGQGHRRFNQDVPEHLTLWMPKHNKGTFVAIVMEEGSRKSKGMAQVTITEAELRALVADARKSGLDI